MQVRPRSLSGRFGKTLNLKKWLYVCIVSLFYFVCRLLLSLLKWRNKNILRNKQKQTNNQPTKQPNNQPTKQPNNQTTKQPNNQTTKQNVLQERTCKQLWYRRAELRSSDHRPVSALFDVHVKKVVPEKRQAVMHDIIESLTKYENEARPDCTVSDSQWQLEPVRFEVPQRHKLTLRNNGPGAAKFRFVARPDAKSPFPEWLTVKPHKGFVAPNTDVSFMCDSFGSFCCSSMCVFCMSVYLCVCVSVCVSVFSCHTDICLPFWLFFVHSAPLS